MNEIFYIQDKIIDLDAAKFQSATFLNDLVLNIVESTNYAKPNESYSLKLCNDDLAPTRNLTWT